MRLLVLAGIPTMYLSLHEGRGWVSCGAIPQKEGSEVATVEREVATVEHSTPQNPNDVDVNPHQYMFFFDISCNSVVRGHSAKRTASGAANRTNA